MDYEKKYNEALKRAKEYTEHSASTAPEAINNALYSIFPELAESEDEKILRCLKEIVNWGCAKNISVECGVELKDVKSWLEKYKEPKPIYEDEYQKMLADSYNCGKDEVISNPEKYGLQKPAEWNEEDEKMLQHIISDLREFRDCETDADLVSDYEDEISWLKSLCPSWKPSEEDLMMLEHIIEQYETGNKNSKVMGYLPRVEELSFLKKVFEIWKN